MTKVSLKICLVLVLFGLGACSPSGSPENRRGQSGSGDPAATIDGTDGGTTDADEAGGEADSSGGDATSDPCGANLLGREDIPSPSKDQSHIVFSLNQNNVDPCSVSGFIVGQQDKEVVNAGGGVYYIPDVPAGSYDVILQANGAPLESADASNPTDIAGANLAQVAQKFGLRVNRVVAQANQVTELDPTETFLRKVGSVTGIAKLEAQSDHTGILVAIPGTHWNAITDAEGKYTIPEVVPGVHDFSLFKDQYIPGRIGEATVEADTQLVLPTITLVLNTGEAIPLVPSAADQPSRDLRLDFAIQSAASPIKMKVSLDPGCANQLFVPFASSATITVPATDAIKTSGYDAVEVYVCVIDRDNTPSTLSHTFVIDIFGLEGGAPTFDTPAALTSQYGPTAIISNIAPSSAEFSAVGFRVNDPAFEVAAIFDPESYGRVSGDSTGFLKVDLGGGDAVCGDNYVFVRLVSPDGYQSAVAKKQVDYQCWQSLTDENYPDPHSTETILGAGDRVFVFGDGTYSQYRPELGTWSDLPLTNRPDQRRYPWIFWTGSSYAVFGGYNSSFSGPDYWYNGGFFRPATNEWAPISDLTGAVSPINESGRTGLWLGDRIFVWGGRAASTSQKTNTGAVYLPVTDSWYATSDSGAPPGRISHTATWTGSRVVIWGGLDTNSDKLNTGAIYDPFRNLWTAIPTSGAPSARTDHAAVWTGERLIIYGGRDASNTSLADAYALENIETSPTWTALPAAPFANYSAEYVGLIADELVFYYANPSTDFGVQLAASLDSWSSLEDSCTDFASWSGTGAVGDALLTWPANCGKSVYHPTTKQWTTLPTTGQPVATGNGYFDISSLGSQAFVIEQHFSANVGSTIFLQPEPIKVAWLRPNDREFGLVSPGEAVELGLRVVNGPIAQASASLVISSIEGPATIGQNNLSLGALASHQVLDVAAAGSLAIQVDPAAKTGDTIAVTIEYQLPFAVVGQTTIRLVVGPTPKPSLVGLVFDPLAGPGLGDTVNATITLGNFSLGDITITSISRGADTCITALGSPAAQALALTDTYQTTVSLTADTDPACEGWQGDLVLDVTYDDADGNTLTTTLEKAFYIGATIELQSDTTPESIPDNDLNGVDKSLTFTGSGTVGGLEGIDAIKLRVQFTHSFASDCNIFLEAPDGTRVLVSGFSNGSPVDMTFTESSHPVLADLVGKNLNGTWIVTINDIWGRDTGTWNEVELTLSASP